MRRIMPLMLAVAMILSMGLRSAEAQATEVGTTSVKAGYAASPETEQIISVDIVWGGMEFTYNGEGNPVWDPENHQYKESKAGWEKSNAYIGLKNNSNVILQADIDYLEDGDYESMWLEFTSTSPFIGSAETAEIGAGQGKPCEVTIRAIPMGTLEKNTAAGTEVGQIKVTVTPQEGTTGVMSAFETIYEDIHAKKDDLDRGDVYYGTADGAERVKELFGTAYTTIDNGDSAAQQNLAINAMIIAHYNNLNLMQDTE